LTSNTQSNNQITVIIGDEFDDALRLKLFNVLKQLGAIAQGQTNWFVAGSQELSELKVILEEQVLYIEAETFIGLSLTGNIDVVQRICELLKK